MAWDFSNFFEGLLNRLPVGALFFSSAFVLFAPTEHLQVIGLEAISGSHRALVGAVFLVSGSNLLIHFFKLAPWAEFWQLIDRSLQSRKRRKILSSLSKDDTQHVANFYNAHQGYGSVEDANASLNDIEVDRLIGLDIICLWKNINGYKQLYQLSPWAKKLITEDPNILPGKFNIIP